MRAVCGTSLGGDSRSQWGSVCTAGGNQSFPYGDFYEPQRCASKDTDAGGTKPAGSMPDCEGSVPGVFDLSGNVFEYLDSCEPGISPGEENVICAFRGGSWSSDGPGMQCGSARVAPRYANWDDVGFRCCSRD